MGYFFLFYWRANDAKKMQYKKWGHRACLRVSRLLKWGIFTCFIGALMTRKSCAVGMRNAILRNYLKDGAYYCYCAYVLRISRYSDFISLMLTNTGIFLRGLKLSGESRS